MSWVQLRNKWWHRTTYSATNKTFALASESETAINPATAPEMSETEALKKVYYFWVCTRNTPISLAFKKQNIHHVSQSGETLSDFLQKRALPPNTAVMKRRGLDSPREPLGAMLISHPSFEGLCLCHGTLSPASHSYASCATRLRSSHQQARTIQCRQQEKAKATLICKQWYSNFLVLIAFSWFPGYSWKKPTGGSFSSRTQLEKVSDITHRKSTILQEEFALSEVCWDVRGKMGAERLNLVRMEVLENIQSRSLATWESWILKT